MDGKPAARAGFRKARRDLSPELQAQNSYLISVGLASWIHETFPSGSTVALYSSMPKTGEVCTSHLHELLQRNYALYYPKVLGRTMAFPRVHRLQDLSPGFKDVPEPVVADRIPVSRLGLIIVPGVAFTPDGARLGQGGGHYDRLLSSPGVQCTTVGLAHRVQIAEVLPMETTDCRVDRVFTEDGWL